VCESELTLRELPEDGHGGDSSESNGHQLGEPVARKVSNQLRGHVFGLFFVTNDRSRDIVTGGVQQRAQELRADVAGEESRSEGKDEHCVVGGYWHHTMFPSTRPEPGLPRHERYTTVPYLAFCSRRVFARFVERKLEVR